MAVFRRGIGSRAKTKLDVGALQMRVDELGVASKCMLQM